MSRYKRNNRRNLELQPRWATTGAVATRRNQGTISLTLQATRGDSLEEPTTGRPNSRGANLPLPLAASLTLLCHDDVTEVLRFSARRGEAQRPRIHPRYHPRIMSSSRAPNGLVKARLYVREHS